MGGLIPLRPTVIFDATMVPSGSLFAAAENTFSPGLRSASVAGAKATTVLRNLRGEVNYESRQGPRKTCEDRQGHGAARSASGWQNPSKHKRLGRCEGSAAQRVARGPGDRRAASIGAQGAIPRRRRPADRAVCPYGRRNPRKTL